MDNQELRRVGLKVTSPRLKILQILEQQGAARHLSAEDVYRTLLAAGEDVGLATVYRVLTQFEAAGLVKRHNFEEGHSVFELNQGIHHDHLVCVKCGYVAEFVDELIRGFGKTVAQRKGYEHKSSRFDILGYCRDCNAKDEAHRFEEAFQSLANALTKLEEASGLIRQTLESARLGKPLKTPRSKEASVEQIKAALAECQTALVLISRNTTHQSID